MIKISQKKEQHIQSVGTTVFEDKILISEFFQRKN
jgi:hypothetical protein